MTRHLWTFALLCLACTPDGSGGTDREDAGPTDDASVSADDGVSEDGGGAGDEGVAGDAAPPDAAASGCGAQVDCDALQEEGPGRLNEHAAVFNARLNVMVLFGGNTAVPENCGFPAYTFQPTTWFFVDHDQACGHWARLEDGPSPRTRHAAAADDDAMWIFGGRFRAGTSGSYQVKDDLWRLDIEARTWARIEPQGAGPAGRFNTTLVHDPVRDVLWLQGGNGNGGINPTPLGDLWRYDIAANTWTQVAAQGGPGARMWHTALFDAARDRLVVYGGADETAFNDDARYFSDLWAYDPEADAWSELPFGVFGPAGRFWGAITHDTAEDRYLLFAGHDDGQLGNRNDLWGYDAEAQVWAQHGDEDTYNRPANGFCDFPADFTIVAEGTPERRNAHSWVWNETCGRALAFGGKTDCGATDDVWRYDSATGWSNPVQATEGEMCHRWRSNPDNCVNMCF